MNSIRPEWVSRLRWHAGAMADKLDHLGILILVLVFLIAGIGVTVLWPLQQQLSGLDSEAAGLDRPAAPVVPASAPPAATGQDTAASFLAFLPSSTRQTQLLQQLHDLAPGGNLTPGKVRYSPVALAHLPVDGLLIHLEWSGDDEALRTTLHRLQQHFPSLAIRQLTYGRNPDTGMTTLALELALYMRREAADVPR